MRDVWVRCLIAIDCMGGLLVLGYDSDDSVVDGC